MSINSDYLVSIIVPVYNMGELLPKCLDSILSQTYEKIELIVIDDGSKDNSGAICDQYANMDNRIKVVHQQNQGIACALNTGLDNVTGSFLLFVDSDDYIDHEMVQRLLSIQIEHDADIVQCDRYSFPNKNGIGIISQQKQDCLFYNNRKEILDDFFHHKKISRNLAARLFRASLFDGIRCEPRRMIIDSVTLPRVLVRCNKYVFVNEKYYYVFEAPTSASRSVFTSKKWDDWKYIHTFIESFVKENCPEYIGYAYYKCVYTSMDAFRAISENKNEPDRKKIMKESMDIFKRYYPLLRQSDYYHDISKTQKKSFRYFNSLPLLYSAIIRLKMNTIKKLRNVKYNRIK